MIEGSSQASEKRRRLKCGTLFLFINIVFSKVSFSILAKFLISALFYIYSMLSKIEYVITVLQSKGSRNNERQDLGKMIWLLIIIRTFVYDK